MNTLITIYKKRLLLENANFSAIEHTDAIVAIVYKVIKVDGSALILKICPRIGDYDCEQYFLKYFVDKIPVPHIMNVIAPEKDIHGAILMTYLAGRLLPINQLKPTLAYEIGTLLAKIHKNKTNAYGDLTKPQSLSQDPAAYFTFKFNEGMDECSEHLPNTMLMACRNFCENNVHLLNKTDGPCIIHRDFRPGNVIVNNGKVQGIIDWSSARAGFAEEDLALLENGTWTNDARVKKSFLAGYAKIRPIPDYKKILPLLQLSKAIAAIGFTVKTQTWQDKNSSLYQRQRQLLENLIK